MVLTVGSFELGLTGLYGLIGSQTRLSLGLYFIFLPLLCQILWKLYIGNSDNPEGLPLPPGPKPLPIIGNLLDFARENESAAYLGMARTYGKFLNLSFKLALGRGV